MDKDCRTCAYSRATDDMYDTGCTAWSCEYIDRQEAIAVWKEFIEEYREKHKGE